MFRQCKNPKGTIDYAGKSYQNLEWLITTLSDLFKRYDPEFIRTPVFELKKVLLQKYGEEAETKLLYHLEEPNDNQEKEEGQTESETLTLRYDHTIPLVRYLVQHQIQKGKFARIGEVFRRDTPSKKQVRLRSFWQADFDFVGESPPLESEILLFSMINDFFEKLKYETEEPVQYQILFNFRTNLFKIFELAQIESEKYNTIASAVDKLDKQTWDEVSLEMSQKGLSEEQISKLKELLDSTYLDPSLKEDYDRLLELNGYANPKQTLKFEPNLARGLDYYTGIIFEVIVEGLQGSVLAGGRYDGLIESYKGTKKGNQIPLVGVSFGLNRLLPLLEKNQPENSIKQIKVYLANIGENLLDKKIQLYRKLVQNDTQANYFICDDQLNGRGTMEEIPFNQKYYFETTFKKKKLAREINKCTEENFDLMIVLAGSEEEKNEYQIKIIKTSETYFLKQDHLASFLEEFQPGRSMIRNSRFIKMTTMGFLRKKE